MATPIIIPKQGQSVESCIIVAWKKSVGDSVASGDVVAEVETDKAVMEVESPAAGVLLETFFEEGDDVPVLTNIAAVGNQGDDVGPLRPNGAPSADGQVETTNVEWKAPESSSPEVSPTLPVPQAGSEVSNGSTATSGAISPRAKNLAQKKGIATASLSGSGPHGRIIERDVLAHLAKQAPLTPAAIDAANGSKELPSQGTGIGGRVVTTDLTAPAVEAPLMESVSQAPFEEVPVRGVRKLIADRMLASLQTTAQLTLNSSADARSLQRFRKEFKGNDQEHIAKITLNDMVLFTVSRTLSRFREMNATFSGDSIRRFSQVHLGFAVDTPRGLVVPVLQHADRLSLAALSQRTKQLATAAQEGKIDPELLQGGTFTVTNLGSLGVDTFTPVLNPPQVGILGVGGIQLKPMQVSDEVHHIPHLSLSLTINHQVVDGAPAAKFLQAIGAGLANFGVTLAS